MMNLKKVLIFFGIVLLISACGNSSNSKKSNIEEISHVAKNIELNDSVEDGVSTKEIDIVVKSESSNQKVVEAVIPEETVFENEHGEPIDTVPVIHITQKEVLEKDVKESKFSIRNRSKVEIKIEDYKGKRVIPSKPLKVTLKAPKEAKAGDKVRVEIPDGAVIEDKDNNLKEKLIVAVVSSDGYIHVKIFPEVFKKVTVVVIIVEKIVEQIITGGAGGN